MNFDRLLQPLYKIVQALAKKSDYQGVYPANLETQNIDGTVDITPEDTTRPGLQNVPLKFGAPATTAVLRNGLRVFFEYENGSPSAPVVVGYTPSSSLVLAVSFFDPSPPSNSAPVSVPPIPTGLTAPTFAGVVRIGDLAEPTVAMATWMATISAALQTAPPEGPIAYSSTGSDKVKTS